MKWGFFRGCRCRQPRQALLLGLLILLSGPAAAEVRIDIQGIGGALRDNVRNYLGTPPGDSEALVRGFARRAPELAQQGLQALGHYNAQVNVARTREDDDWVIRLDIDPGEPVRIAELDISIRGDAEDDPAFLALREQLPLSEGDVLHHGRYEATKRAFENLALTRGYFDSRFETSRIAVHRGRNEATIVLLFNSGPRYRLGEVGFPELPLSDTLLRRLVPFDTGDPYGSENIARLNRNLLESGYFETVRIRPRPGQAGEDLRIPIAADLSMTARNRVGVGAGFATDVGPRLRLNLRRPWVNADGHSFTSSAELSGVRQNVKAQYNMPLNPPLEQQLQFFGGLQLEDIEDTRSDTATVGIQRQRTLTSGWRQTISLRWQREEFTQAGFDGTSTLTLPGTSVERTRSRGGLDPDWGDRQFASLELTHPELGSDQQLARFRMSTKWIRSIDRHRLTASAEYGALSTDSLDNTPPSLRFFAGGDQSVRGFSYQSLAPEDAQGRLVGGRYLLVGSLEYSYAFAERWRAATFIDAGNAFADSNFSGGFARGAGVGIRWQSPVGPVRLDFAWGISEPDRPFRFHLTLGPAL